MSMDFGGLRAVEKLDLQVRRGEIVALIGPNGAGKTTFFKLHHRHLRSRPRETSSSPPPGGAHRINGLKPNRVTEQGLARTFQNIRLFPSMTSWRTS